MPRNAGRGNRKDHKQLIDEQRAVDLGRLINSRGTSMKNKHVMPIARGRLIAM